MSECSRPVRIHANTLGIDGEYGNRRITVNCGSRIADECEYCSKIYRGDSFALLRDGFMKLEPGEQAYFVTVTAPGSTEFGQTHGLRHGGQCPCGVRHRKSDDVLGTPVDPETYRYDLAAGFNKASARLFTLGIQRLRRWIKPSFGTVRYIRVVEWQRRGLIHVHAIVITTADEFMIRRAFQGGPGIRGSFRRHAPVSHDGFTWGPRMDVQKIEGETGPTSVRRYMAKLVGYVSKAVATGLHGVHQIHADMLQTAALTRCKCDRLASGCLRGRYRHGRGNQWRSNGTDHLCRRHNRAFKMAGFTGHVFGRARDWGPKTRSYLKDVRREHVRTSIAMDIADQRGDEAAQRYLDECDAPSVEIVAARTSSFARVDPAVIDEVWRLAILANQDIAEQRKATDKLTGQFVRYAERRLPEPVLSCLECGDPSLDETCALCERERYEDEHPTLDRRSADRIIWAIAQRRLHLDHAPLPASSAWWAEAELYSAAPPVVELELSTLF